MGTPWDRTGRRWRSAATAHEAQLALHQLQVLELVDQQCHADESQPGSLDELVEAGGLPAGGGEHQSLLVGGWGAPGDGRTRAGRFSMVGGATQPRFSRGGDVVDADRRRIGAVPGTAGSMPPDRWRGRRDAAWPM